MFDKSIHAGGSQFVCNSKLLFINFCDKSIIDLAVVVVSSLINR